MSHRTRISTISMGWLVVFCVALFTVGLGFSGHHARAEIMSEDLRFIQVKAKDKHERSAIANFGVSIESVMSDSIWGFATTHEVKRLLAAGYQVVSNVPPQIARGGHEELFGFPPQDSLYHTYDQLVAALKDLQAKNSDSAQVVSIGKTIQGRDIWAIHLNTNASALSSGQSNQPGIVFMGNHHAREHLSLEVPLKLAQHLLGNRSDRQVGELLSSRDIWIIPMVNPDGAEYDISGGRYAMWRKNRRDNGDGTFGVDLNRNYGYEWGTGGSSSDTYSDVYMGKTPFSEPETTAIKNFVDAHSNLKILLSFHTYSELILYPWGHSNDPISKTDDRTVYETMARKMAEWNHYTPEQSSDLYIASGDTTDWAYGAHGIFAFTFELSPKNSWGGGGFYPGAQAIDRVFKANISPCLYLIGLADDPYKVLKGRATDYLTHYVQPQPQDDSEFGYTRSVKK